VNVVRVKWKPDKNNSWSNYTNHKLARDDGRIRVRLLDLEHYFKFDRSPFVIRIIAQHCFSRDGKTVSHAGTP
jgi:hypothetical protein